MAKKYKIMVTIITGAGAEFYATFDTAADAFIALSKYISCDTRQCYFTDNLDSLMELLLDISRGKIIREQCSTFRLEAIDNKLKIY